jgi:hypothetical protein
MGQCVSKKPSKLQRWTQYLISLEGQYTGATRRHGSQEDTKWTWFQLQISNVRLDEYKATLMGQGLCTYRTRSGNVYLIPSLLVLHVEHFEIVAIDKEMVYVDAAETFHRDNVTYSCCNHTLESSERTIQLQNRHCQGVLKQLSNTLVTLG